MTSLWKDLLFLHGHLLHRDDLDWRPDAAPEPGATRPATPPPAAPARPAPARDATACA